MLNKKGFTIAEVVVSFGLISVILISMISSAMFYRDKLKSEEVVTQLLDFKNTVTTVVYDDIMEKEMVRADTCIGTMNCVVLTDKNGVDHILKIYERETSSNDEKKGVYISYDETKYMLPDSDLGSGNDRVCDFVGGFEVKSYDNKLYKIKTSFVHKDMNLNYDLLFIID